MKVAINGFGRIGRLTFRTLIERENVDIVAINDLTDRYTLAHLLKYDTAHGILNKEIKANENSLFYENKAIVALSEPDPLKIPWKDMDVDIVLECTGHFQTKEDMEKHLQAGAKKVILSAPARSDVKTIVLGVNDDQISASDKLLSNASCTTNCLAPMVKVLHQNFGIEKGFMTTIHAYTADQNLQDGPHKDMRRARSAANNIVPTTTGAARAIDLVMPEVAGRLNGGAMRVPVIDGSLTEMNVLLQKEPSVKSINQAFLKASETNMRKILQYLDVPLVSSDIVGNPHSCIYDAALTLTDGNLVRIVGWYDNEFGYSTRLADLTELVGKMN